MTQTMPAKSASLLRPAFALLELTQAVRTQKTSVVREGLVLGRAIRASGAAVELDGTCNNMRISYSAPLASRTTVRTSFDTTFIPLRPSPRRAVSPAAGTLH